MSRTFAIAKRILLQFLHDKRTLVLLFIAPIIVLWLLTILLGANEYEPKVAAINLPAGYVTELKKQDVTIINADEKEATAKLKADKIDAILTLPEGSTTLQVNLEGSDRTHNAAVLSSVADATTDFAKISRADMQKEIDKKKQEIEDKKAEIEQKKAEAKAKQAEIKSKIADAKAKAKKQQAAMKKKQATAKEQLAAIIVTLPEPQKTQLSDSLNSMFSSLSSGSSMSGMMDSIDIDSINLDSMNIDTSDFDIDFDVDKYMPVQEVNKTYLHGSDDWEMFDFYGPIFIALFLFVFTFLTSGMSLVNERSAGTMNRFLLTPVKPWQILGGYDLGFGALACVQGAVIVTIGLKFIGFPNEGNVLYIILIAVSVAVASVTMGLLVSGMAHNAFQVVQLMLLFVVPQILLCGLFDLSGAPRWIQILSECLPLTYGVDAMREVMLRGSGFNVIATDLAVVWGFTVLFFLLSAFGFRKKAARRLPRAA